MAIVNTPNDLTITSLKENLIAIKYCLVYEKKSYNNNENGCLGVPATILMCSVIDTIGSYYRGSGYKIKIDNKDVEIKDVRGHFYVLNHPSYFNLNLSRKTIDDFYSTYRSKLTHNNTLPPNNYLYYDKNSEVIFGLNDSQKITHINLFALFERVHIAVDHFIYHLESITFSKRHILSEELRYSSKEIISLPTLPAPSGVCNYDEYFKNKDIF